MIWGSTTFGMILNDRETVSRALNPHAFDSQLTLLRIQPRFSRSSAGVVSYPGIVVMETSSSSHYSQACMGTRQYPRRTCMAWPVISARVRTYVLACAYALRAVRQHRARPYRIALLVLTLPHSNAEEELNSGLTSSWMAPYS